MSPTLIIVIIAAAVLLWLWATYNGLVRSKLRTDEAWSDINVQLKRRYDLIPNLVSAVKGYAKHEDRVFTEVTEARTKAMSARGLPEKAEAEDMLGGALKHLFALAEAYPELKANQNFAQLQDELVDTEDKVQAARRFYNGSVRDYNIKLQVFPTNLIAHLLGFSPREFFEPGNQAEINEPVKVEF